MFEGIATEIEGHESRGFMDARNSSLWLTAHVQGEDIEKQTFNETILSLVVGDALVFRKYFAVIWGWRKELSERSSSPLSN